VRTSEALLAPSRGGSAAGKRAVGNTGSVHRMVRRDAQGNRKQHGLNKGFRRKLGQNDEAATGCTRAEDAYEVRVTGVMCVRVLCRTMAFFYGTYLSSGCAHSSRVEISPDTKNYPRVPAQIRFAPKPTRAPDDMRAPPPQSRRLVQAVTPVQYAEMSRSLKP
jgi:hypothetical protein